MAGKSLFFDGVPLSKSVQEMSVNGDEPPPEFHVKDSSLGGTDSSHLSSSVSDSVPVVDLSLLLSSKDELEQIGSRIRRAIGHGMSSSFIDQVRGVAKHFFGLPQEEKIKYSRTANGVEGYGHDLVVSDKQVLDWNTRLFLRVFPENQ
ncbi:hypothetical protein V6N13_000389 [Hibiscus sabdariffa]|uniref:Non-haem dioxygenase N-terminal domain-containing protein n=1 Tax=Hibiscus sabdariffa TaxID=183260 RepID=A0ABR2G5C9_9ROSI